MSRHRNVRSMNYEDECYDDDDYLGHSVEDSYCISPGTVAQFTFNRNKDVNLSSFMEEEGIPEEDEEEYGEEQRDSLNDSSNYSKPKLSDTDEAKLNSCMEGIRNVLGESYPDHVLAQSVVRNNYNMEAALNDLLTQQDAPKPQRAPRQNRRNRSQGDDDSDDFDDFLDSLNSQSPDKPLFFSNQNPQIGILKFGQSPPVFEKQHKAKNIDLKTKEIKIASASMTQCPNLVQNRNNTVTSCNTMENKTVKVSNKTIKKRQKDLAKRRKKLENSSVSKKISLADLANTNLNKSSKHKNLNEISLADLAKKEHLPKPKTKLDAALVSKTNSLTELATQDQAKIIPGAPPVSKTLSLADLGKQDKSKITYGGPQISIGVSLADLARQDKTNIIAEGPPILKGLSLADLAKQDKTKTTAGNPQTLKGVSLTDLAKQDKTKTTAGSPQTSKGVSLADLALKHEKTTANVEKTQDSKIISLADLAKNNNSTILEEVNIKYDDSSSVLSKLAKQDRTKDCNIGSLKVVSSPAVSSGISLAEIAKEQAKTKTSLGITESEAKDIRKMNFEEEKKKNVSLADLAKQNTSVERSVTGSLPLADYVKQNRSQKGISPDEMSKQDILKAPPLIGSKTDSVKGVSSRDVTLNTETITSSGSGLSLADIARQHRSDGGSLVGSLSGLSLKDLAAQKNVQPKENNVEGNIENLSSIPKISLKDLAVKNSSKISRKQEKAIVSKDGEISPRGFKSTQGIENVSDVLKTLNLVDNQSSTGQVSSKEITITLCAKPSTLAKSVCFQSRMSYNPVTGLQVTHQKLKFPKFSYSYQTKHHSCVSTILHQHITPFDFSTPSPDDVVKSKQKAAFTRSGEKGNK